MSELLHSELFISREPEYSQDVRRYPETPFSQIAAELGFCPDAILADHRQALLDTQFDTIEDQEDAFDMHFALCDKFMIYLTEQPEQRANWSRMAQGFNFYIVDTWHQANHHRACLTSLQWLREDISHSDPSEQTLATYIDAAIRTLAQEKYSSGTTPVVMAAE